METTLRPIGIIHSDADYNAALAEFESYFDNEPAVGSPEADRFELLGMVIAKFEEERWPIEAAKPLDVLKFMMEQNDRTQTDLANLLGSRSRASELLNGKRDLTLEQIKLLSREWRIPAGALIGELEHA